MICKQSKNTSHPSNDRKDIEVLINKAAQLVAKNPEKAATILTDWIHGARPKKTKK
jgi:flagellar biosynthesis/type III secretory pathway M-ring protein FliF/YscJ